MIYADEILDRKKKRGEITASSFSPVTRSVLMGMTAGLIGGALYAYFEQKKYLPSMAIGSLSAGIISRLLLIKKK